jgi:hypothetical protein
MTLKIRLAFTVVHRLLYLKQKNLGVANTLTGGDNQFTRSKKILQEIRENNVSKLSASNGGKDEKANRSSVRHGS